jgi:hypothetical protein
MANKNLGELITWLKAQPKKQKVENGFGAPHSDRGYYEDCGFDPVEKTTIGEMLKHARSALGKEFRGWKGGNYKMTKYSNVLIGNYGQCGEQITDTHLKYWDETGV